MGIAQVLLLAGFLMGIVQVLLLAGFLMGIAQVLLLAGFLMGIAQWRVSSWELPRCCFWWLRVCRVMGLQLHQFTDDEPP